MLSATSVVSAYSAWQAKQHGLGTAAPFRAQATNILLESHSREQHAAGVQRQATSAIDGTHAVVAVCSPSGGWASGVIVSQSGLVLTNAHALDVAKEPASGSGSGRQQDSLLRNAFGRANGPRLEVLVSGAPGSLARYSAKVIYIFNSALDLAVLQIAGGQGKFRPAQLYTDTLVRGQKVFVVSPSSLCSYSCPFSGVIVVFQSWQLPLAGWAWPVQSKATAGAAVHQWDHLKRCDCCLGFSR